MTAVTLKPSTVGAVDVFFESDVGSVGSDLILGEDSKGRLFRQRDDEWEPVSVRRCMELINSHYEICGECSFEWPILLKHILRNGVPKR